VLIGPNSLAVITDREIVEAAAEVGVILLLFTIGMEFSLERLGRLWRAIFLGGGLQVLSITALVIVVLTVLDVPMRPAIYTGLLVALSSTALVLRLLADRGETGVIAICFGTAYLTSLAGVSVSLGAFLAGLVVQGRYGTPGRGPLQPARRSVLPSPSAAG